MPAAPSGSSCVPAEPRFKTVAAHRGGVQVGAITGDAECQRLVRSRKALASYVEQRNAIADAEQRPLAAARHGRGNHLIAMPELDPILGFKNGIQRLLCKIEALQMWAKFASNLNTLDGHRNGVGQPQALDGIDRAIAQELARIAARLDLFERKQFGGCGLAPGAHLLRKSDHAVERAFHARLRHKRAAAALGFDQAFALEHAIGLPQSHAADAKLAAERLRRREHRARIEFATANHAANRVGDLQIRRYSAAFVQNDGRRGSSHHDRGDRHHSSSACELSAWAKRRAMVLGRVMALPTTTAYEPASSAARASSGVSIRPSAITGTGDSRTSSRTNGRSNSDISAVSSV